MHSLVVKSPEAPAIRTTSAERREERGTTQTLFQDAFNHHRPRQSEDAVITTNDNTFDIAGLTWRRLLPIAYLPTSERVAAALDAVQRQVWVEFPSEYLAIAADVQGCTPTRDLFVVWDFGPEQTYFEMEGHLRSLAFAWRDNAWLSASRTFVNTGSRHLASRISPAYVQRFPAFLSRRKARYPASIQALASESWRAPTLLARSFAATGTAQCHGRFQRGRDQRRQVEGPLDKGISGYTSIFPAQSRLERDGETYQTVEKAWLKRENGKKRPEVRFSGKASVVGTQGRRDLPRLAEHYLSEFKIAFPQYAPALQAELLHDRVTWEQAQRVRAGALWERAGAAAYYFVGIGVWGTA